jgi:hypothetical protein
MIKTRAISTVSLLALTLSVYVCLFGTVNVRALAQKSAAIVAVKSQSKKGLKPAVGVTAQIERPIVEAASEEVRFSKRNESRISQPSAACTTFCALLSKYLSLS